LIDDEGIYVEQFDTSNTSQNRYTENNIIYQTDRVFTYDYFYQDKSGSKYKFEIDKDAWELGHPEMARAWKWVELNSVTDRTINTVELNVKYGLEPFIERNPEYNQTVITYFFPQVDGLRDFNSSTGVIENESNVWIHPPRQRFFKILEINPFPFIKQPYEVGNKWNWSLQIGKFWGDERWATWEESIENQYQYEITGRTEIRTTAGVFSCLIVESTASSRIGSTELISYFNEEHGFIKMEYTNIDSTKTVLELVDYTEINHDE